MKIIAWIIISVVSIGFMVMVLCGCKTNSSGWPIIWGGHQAHAQAVPQVLIPPVYAKKISAPAVVSNAAIQPARTVTISWTPNYVNDAEETGIEVSQILKPPVWRTVFAGRTNQCVMAVNQSQQFFRAYNFLP